MKQSIGNKRIALFHNLPGGGSVRVIQKVYEYLVDNKFQIDIYTTTENNNLWRDSQFPQKQIIYHIKPWPGFLLRNLWLLTKLPQIHQKIADTINNKDYLAAIITHDYFTKSPYLLRYLKTKKIYILHEPQREFYEPSKFHTPLLKDKIANIIRYPIKFIDLFNTSKADVILANSKYSQQVIKKTYKRQSILFYPGVDTKLFKPNSTLKKEKLFLLVGGLSRVKGHDFIIKSIKSLLGEFKMIIIGDGRKEDSDYLQNIVGEKKQYLQIIDHVSDIDLAKFYQKAAILCIGSYNEPFGITSIEAQACETPVVAVTGGGVDETIIDGITGYLSGRTEDDFLNKVRLSLTNNKKLGVSGRKNVINNWTWEQTLNKLNETIRS